jgi:hypothetical protein
MEKETKEMKDELGYPTTPKLRSLLRRQVGGEDTVKDLASYARRGYREAEEGLIDAAEAGNTTARSSLSEIVIRSDNCLQPDQMRRALEHCDLEESVKHALLKRQANKGQVWALNSLKSKQAPQTCTDSLGLAVQETILRHMSGADGLWSQHLTSTDLRALERELLREGNSALEQLLVRRIGLCYLFLHYLEFLYALDLDKPKNSQNHSLLLKRIHQASERYLSAVRTLAQVRKLQLPNLQVNIGQKQVNMLGLAPPDTKA